MCNNTLQKIAEYYYEISNKNINDAINAVNKLQIQYIDEDDSSIVIGLCRPGLLIGKRGSNISSLREKLGKEIKIYQTKSPIDELLEHICIIDGEYN